jgi:carboxyl-terminal processing protease
MFKRINLTILWGIALLLSAPVLSMKVAPPVSVSESETTVGVIAAENKEYAMKLQKEIFRLVSVLQTVQENYIDKPTIDQLIDGALKGMISELDPHSIYLTKEENEEFKENMSGKFGGIGIVVSKTDDGIVVISPIDDTPAKRAGIKSKDLIIQIDRKSVYEMSLKESTDLMRGEPETDINLTIKRKGEKPFEVDLTRAIIKVDTVKSYILEDEIVYIRISSFGKETATKIAKALEEKSEELNGNLKSIIIDLRDNPGGLLLAATKISDIFLEEGEKIVSTKSRTKTLYYKAKTKDFTDGADIVVLMNGGSASASEILAGALKDNKRAIIMGETSFGKGSVQSYVSMNDGSAYKITTARYYTPNGTSIQAKGIEPDIKLKEMILKEKEKEVVLSIKEADLEGHLESEGLGTDDRKAEKEKTAKIKELEKDYYISEASNLLKALRIVRR